MLEDIFKALIEAEADRLPGGSVAATGVYLRGQIIATGRALQAFRTNGGQQIDDIDFSGRAFDELHIPGQFAQVCFGKEHGADGKRFRPGWQRYWRGVFLTFTYNSINTIAKAK